MIKFAAKFVVFIALTGVGSSLRADVFQLKDGGEVVGKAIQKSDAGDYVVRTDDGAEITLHRDALQRVVEDSADAAEYLARSRKAPDTADSHRQLAAWCKEHKLLAEANVHLARVVELDPVDDAARKSLGLQQVGDRWLNSDEVQSTRGLKFFDGKYRTTQDIAIRQRDKQEGDASNEWFKNLKLWCGWLEKGRPERAAEAQARIAAINDPGAAPALVRLLGSEEDQDVFELMLATLGRLDHPVAAQALVAYSLDPNAGRETRAQCLDYLTNGLRSVSIVPYVHALKSKDNKVVNLAGHALEKIGDPAAISPLIDALVTTHRYQVQPESGGGTQFNSAFNPSGGGGGGLSMGSSGPKFVDEHQQNESVLQALKTLSGKQNFEYDEPAWRAWYVDLQMRQRINTRRDD